MDILCPDIFNNKNAIGTVYLQMAKTFNDCNATLIYPLPITDLNQNIKSLRISNQQSEIYAGHDLPVWLGNPCGADIRIMVLSQDPRRNDAEMKVVKNSKGIGLSSPFGLHSPTWRAHKMRGLVHYVFIEMIQSYAKKGICLSVYYTDVYKFRGVDSKTNSSVIDIANQNLYLSILEKELSLYKPDAVLLMGKSAQTAYQTFHNMPQSNKSITIEVPHPNARPSTWKNRFPDMGSFDAESKRKTIKDSIESSICTIRRPFCP